MLPASIWLEKRPGHGEDAQPLEVSNENLGTLVAVFDGLGGAGAAKIEQPGEEATSEARLAAQYLREQTKEYFGTLQSTNDLYHIELNLSEFLRNRLKSYNSTLPRVKSKLKSSLSKQLPSTGCILIHNTAEVEPVLNAIWAGDSRAYRVRTDGALECLTPDHVKHRSHQSKLDYFVSNGDATMTNSISASNSFELYRNESDYFAKDTIVAFVCSDGVFGAFKDHLRFEQAVLKTLIGVTSPEEFEQYIDEHRSDDVSLQTIVIQDADQHREAIEKRLELLERAIDEDKDADAFFSVVKENFPFVLGSIENNISNNNIPPPADLKKKESGMKISLPSILIGASLGLGTSAIAILTLTNLAPRNQLSPLEQLTQTTVAQTVAAISAREAPRLAMANTDLAQAEEALTSATTDREARLSERDQLLLQQEQANSALTQAEEALTSATADREARLSERDQLLLQQEQANSALTQAEEALTSATTDREARLSERDQLLLQQEQANSALTQAEEALTSATADREARLSERDQLLLQQEQANSALTQAEEANSALTQAEEALASATTDLEARQSERDQLLLQQEQANSALTQAEEANSALTQAEEALASATTDLEARQSERDQLLQDQAQNNSALTQAEEALTSATTDLEARQSERDQLLQDQTQNNSALTQAEEALTSATTDLEARQSERDQLLQEQEQANSALTQAEEALTSATSDLEARQSERDQLLQDQEQANSALTQAEEALASATTDLEARQSERDQLLQDQAQNNSALTQAEEALTSATTDLEARQSERDQLLQDQERTLEQILNQIRAAQTLTEQTLQAE